MFALKLLVVIIIGIFATKSGLKVLQILKHKNYE